MQNDGNSFNNSKVLKLLIATLIGFVLFVGGYLLIDSLRFYAEGTTPNSSTIPTDTPHIDFIFSKDVSEVGSVVADVQEIIQGYEINNSRVRVFLDSLMLSPQADYQITLSMISSGDKLIDEFSYSFSTITVRFEDQTKAQQQAAIDDVDRDLEELDQIFIVLPYINRADNFYADAIDAGDGSYAVEIKALEGSKKVTAGNIEEVKSYLVDKGIDLSAYQFVID